LTLEAAYSVPYTADVSLDYRINRSWHVFGDWSNFYHAFRLDGQPLTNRVFFQMSRAEAGIRFVEPDYIFKGFYFDLAFVVGYAFEQHIATGFDVRSTETAAELSDQPYIGLVLRGRF
jgi:hypothetical protein